MTRAADPPVRGAPRRRGTHGWLDIAILDLDVPATLSEYDDENDMKAIVHDLSLVADAYLRGEGRIEQQRECSNTAGPTHHRPRKRVDPGSASGSWVGARATFTTRRMALPRAATTDPLPTGTG
jgi:hypothetical protein